jgi:negative regulator of flagellin synthesis FlgM
LSYTNGITNSQQGFDAVEAAVTASTSRTAKTEQSATTSVSAALGSNGTGTVDQTSLSSTSGLVAQTLGSSDDVRTEKVAALQQSITSGTYNVSAADVADKLINALLQ